MKTNQQAVIVRVAANAAEREAAFRIRYEVYVEEMGWSTEHANHDGRFLEQPLDRTGEIWIAELDGEIVGTLRINVGSGCDLGFYHDIYSIDSLPERRGAVGIFSNFVIRRSHRNLSIAMQLVRAAFAMVVRAEVRFALLDCEPKMARLYAWMGFEVHIPDFNHPHYGPGICMKMDVNKWIGRFMAQEPAMAA
jgi:GNAT superfamily N-acetyltransferase